MKKYFYALCLLCLFSMLLMACGKEPDNSISAEVGEISFSSLSATDFSGEIVDNSVFADQKLTMVNIWATYCSPCIREMPALAALDESYGEDFAVIGIPIDVVDPWLAPSEDKMTRAREIITETKADYMHLIPSASLVQICLGEVQYVPQTIFVDRNGNQIGDIYSGAMTEQEWSAVIEALLEKVK